MDRTISGTSLQFRSFLEASDTTGALNAIKTVKNIFSNNCGSSTIRCEVSNLFDVPYGFLEFLEDIYFRQKWGEVRKQSLDLLEYLYSNYFDAVEAYCSKTIEICLNIGLADVPATERSRAIDLIAIMLNKTYKIDHKDVEIAYKKIYNYAKIKLNQSAVKVHKSALVLLGVIANRYPYVVKNCDDLTRIIISFLRQQSDAPTKDKTLVSGCFIALEKIFQEFPLDENDSENCEKFYSILKKLFDGHQVRYDLRDGFTFLTTHMCIFSKYMYRDDPKSWHNIFDSLLNNNYENEKVGFKAMEVFYEEISKILVYQTGNRDKEILKYFCDCFLTRIENQFMSKKERALAIQGLTKFSKAYAVQNSQEDLKNLLIIVMKYISCAYYVEDETTMENLEYLSNYIQCLVSILTHLSEHTTDCLDCLQQITVLMIKNFPKLDYFYHQSVAESIGITMFQLYKVDCLKKYLEVVIQQGILWTCSHQLAFEADLEKEKNRNSRVFTYRDYLPVWQTLLKPVCHDTSITSHDRTCISLQVYNELLNTLFYLINKLNLRTNHKNNCDTTDPESSIEIAKEPDLKLFINLVDLYVEILAHQPKEYFEKRLHMYIKQIILKSTQLPLISGFYKLLTIGLKVADDLKYFETETALKDDKNETYNNVLAFLENVIGKVQEYKFDLQLACLELALNVPVAFIKALIPVMSTVFNVSFTLGLSYLNIAHLAITALQKWQNHLTTDDLKPLLKEVLPLLDPFLRSKGFAGDPDIKIPLLQARRLRQSKSKSKLYIESESELLKLQKKILNFVCVLPANLLIYLAENSGVVDQVLWEKEPLLKYMLPFVDAQPPIYFERLLPRVIELALHSGDQKTRVTACELLHSIVIFMLGASRTMNDTKQAELSQVVREVLTATLQLGSDSYEAIKQIFEPLITQLVHWYASPMKMSSIDTIILIEILMEGISHPTNSSMRDLSGKCIKEFVLWTIKQFPVENLEKNRNIELVLDNICMLCEHPNAYKRLGASLAFNQIYTVLREEADLLDVYWIQLTYSFLVNLSLGEASCAVDNKVFTEQTIKHLERVLMESCIMFNRVSARRKVPSALGDGLLSNVLVWILQQTSFSNAFYRAKSLQLFYNLVPYAERNATPKRFISNHFNSPEWYLEIYEANTLAKMPKLNFCTTSGNITILSKWLYNLSSCLDIYSFLLENTVVTAEDISNKSCIFTALLYFIENLSDSKLDKAMKLFPQYDTSIKYNAKNTEEYCKLKSEVVIQSLLFLEVLTNQSTDWCTTFDFSFFWNFISNCVFQPNLLGFEAFYQVDTQKLNRTINELFDTFYKKLPTNYLHNLNQNLCNYFRTEYKPDISFKTILVPAKQRYILRGVLQLSKTELNKYMSDISNNFGESTRSVFRCVVTDSKVGHVLPPTVREFAESQLNLSLRFHKGRFLDECLLCKTKITNPENYKFTTHGEYFLDTFFNVLIPYIRDHFSNFVERLTKQWSSFNDNENLTILLKVLKYFADLSRLNDDIASTAMKACSMIFVSTPLPSNKMFQLELATSICKLNHDKTNLGEKFPIFREWFISELNSNSLIFKRKLLELMPSVTGPYDDDYQLLESFIKGIIEGVKNPRDPIELTDLTLLFKKLLGCLIASKSRVVLQGLVEIFINLNDDWKQINIEGVLGLYMSHVSCEAEFESMKLLYQICFNIKYTPMERYKIARTFLLSTIRYSSSDAFNRFYNEVIGNINDLITQVFVPDIESISKKNIAFLVVQTMFLKLDLEVEGLFEQHRPQVIRKRFLSVGKNILEENQFLQSDDYREYKRLFCCTVFNALTSMLLNGSPNIQIDTINDLIGRILLNSKYNWMNMIDCTYPIGIPMDFNELPRKKKVFANIRMENQEQIGSRINYIESQTLFDSTLSENVYNFDFTNSIVRENSFQRDHISSTQYNIDLELTDVNDHEIMPELCGMLDKMSNTLTMDSPPKWLLQIQTILDTSPEKNIRIFFARLIHNRQDIFKLYASQFFDSIVKFILDKCTGGPINYFVADLVQMLISWSEKVDKINHKTAISSLVAYLIENAYNEKQPMLKYNIEIIKTVVELWKDFIDVPYDLIAAKFKKGSPEMKAMLNIIGVFLANDILPVQINNINSFTKTLQGLLKDKLYRTAAEVLGMLLHFFQSKPTYETHLDQLHRSVENMLKLRENDKAYFQILELIHRHYTPIIENKMKTMYLSFKTDKEASDLCTHLRNYLRVRDNSRTYLLNLETFQVLLNHSNTDVRLLTLQILNKSATQLSVDTLLTCTKIAYNLKFHENSIERIALYEFCITVYNKWVNTERDGKHEEIFKLCKSVLLTGLLDTDVDAQARVEEFWYNEQYANLSLTRRFLTSVKELYSPDSELYYLGCCNFFLLEGCKDTPDYNKVMFEHGLSECRFDELSINWHAQHSLRRPMFVRTFSSQSSSRTEENMPEFVRLRATNSERVFTPTQQISLQTSTTLLTDLSSKSFNSFLQLNRNTSNEGEVSTPSIKRARRFLRSKHQVSAGYRKMNIEINKQVREYARDHSKMKASNIISYRQYRIGDLPDVQIPNSAIIKPLQVLAQRDGIVGRQLYVMLFISLVSELDDPDTLLQEFNNHVKEIFNSTNMYVPNMIGAFLEILFTCSRKMMNLALFQEPTLLTTVCKNSGLNTMGCLILEDYLQQYDGMPSRRRGVAAQNIDSHWIRLAELYRELGEWDTVTGIFCSNHVNHSETVSRAVQAEGSGLWKVGLNLYIELMKVVNNVDQKDFYHESCYNCYANLSEWGKISEDIVDADDLWDSSFKQECMLPRFITAEVMISLENPENSRIETLLTTWMTDIEKSEYLKDRFAEELAVLALPQNNLKTSKYYTASAFSKFLEDWSNLNPLFPKIRLQKLSNFQKIVDLHKYITFTGDTEDLLRDWERNSDFSSQSIVLTETRTLYRRKMLSTLQQYLHENDELDEYQNRLTALNRKLNLNLIKDSLNKNNYFVARKYLKKHPKLTKIDNLEKLLLAVEAGKIAILTGANQSDDVRVKYLLDAYDRIHSDFISCNNIPEQYKLKHAIQVYNTCQNLCDTLSTNTSLIKKYNSRLESLLGPNKTSSALNIQNFGIYKLQDAITSSEFSLNANSSEIKDALIEAYETFLKFAVNADTSSDYHPIILKYVLRSMACGSKFSKQLFPYLLQMPELCNTLLETFERETTSVPVWMFLTWIPQLLATIKSDKLKATSKILINIAKTYPQALIYTYRLYSQETEAFSQQEHQIRQELIDKLDELLNKNFMDKFFEELSLICIPQVYLKYHLDKIKKHTIEWKTRLEELIKNLEKRSEASPIYKAQLKDYIKDLKTRINAENVVEELDSIINKLGEDLRRQKSSWKNLKRFSPWLSSFRNASKDFDLEIPGQYRGDGKPLINYHVKISSFHANISVMDSLRKPIKITLLGSDFKEYPFLIKFGEDLRQDQRIQQLFTIVNDVLRNDFRTRERYLSLETYAVVPLSSKLGLIKWVGNTKSLDEMMIDNLDKNTLSNVLSIPGEYTKWIRKASSEGEDSIARVYANACRKYSSVDVHRKFSEFVNRVPADVLSKSFLKRSLNLESYASLRQQFVASYSTMCIVNWILGIGDRHLQNTLILQQNGRAIGIDFGMAFGVASQNLSVPELIPFRLTPHILNVLGPLQEIGIEYTMVHCLRALRKHKTMIMFVLNVFIQDPLVDWLEYARNTRSETFSSNDWTPDMKIMTARQKLSGANPRFITENDLKQSSLPGASIFFQPYMDVVRGNLTNVRNRLPDQNLTEEQQIKCLLDQATDYNILGRMFAGLHLWI